MTQPAITTEDRPLVGAYGDVYTAPAGTAAPTDIDTPGTPWVKLGLISEDGATWTPPSAETTDINAWQTLYPVRVLTTSLTTSVNFALMQWDRNTLPFALGGGSFTDDVAGGVTTFHPPAAGAADEKAIFIRVYDAPIDMGIYYPKGRVTEREDATFKKDEAALLGVTFAILGDTALEPYNLLFNSANFPAASATESASTTTGTGDTQTPADAPQP